MPVHELAAVGAAVCWALSGIISAAPAAHLGALAFNRARQVFVAVMLIGYVLATGSWRELGAGTLAPLVLSAIIGIFAGDTLLFSALNRLGPRRSGILFALNAPIGALLGWAVLGEVLPAQAVAGIGVTVAGVALAILYGRGGSLHDLEAVRGALWVGVALGLGAATGQALSSIITRPVMATGLDPAAASLVRVCAAALCLSALIGLPMRAVKPLRPMTWRVAALTALTGFVALAVGMTLMLFALAGGEVGIASTLSATSPALILPLLWWRTGERPAAGAWAGAGLVVAGMALLFLR